MSAYYFSMRRIISGGQTGVDRAALDVAGPRESKRRGIQAEATKVLRKMLTKG